MPMFPGRPLDRGRLRLFDPMIAGWRSCSRLIAVCSAAGAVHSAPGRPDELLGLKPGLAGIPTLIAAWHSASPRLRSCTTPSADSIGGRVHERSARAVEARLDPLVGGR